MLKFINQKPYSRTCGQTTLAILIGKTTEEICKFMKRNGGTNTSDLLRVLDHFEIKTASRKLVILSNKSPLPKRAIIHLRPLKRQRVHWAHWSLKFDDLVYDPRPFYIGPTPTDAYLANLPSNREKITSFLELV